MVRKAMVPADQEDRVVKVEEAETVVLKRPHAEVAAGPKCASNVGHWYCVTHREGFINNFQKDIHIESGKHRFAWICIEHGVEVP